ncbi:sensor histidine kinase [Duganella qianjiadongensis]|uniref:histidine kinase n=1 Tax=Duganella qianjiadongensis TaxID=2692176 RepID=A0ABW9VGS9_9BURK|nr:HAMP domain-containing sensor histidine kinase [Duganella qianjiadongensis]MYM37778.1 hypothetical protein [Duganella qianjiadongensis]
MDAATSSIALSITQFCISIIMIGVYFAAPGERYTRLWAQFGVLTSVGMSLVLVGSTRPPGIFLIAGNVSLFAGCILVWVGLRAFLGRSTVHGNYLLGAAFTAGYVALIGLDASFNTRSIFCSASLIVIFLLCLQTLLQGPQNGRHAYARRTAISGLCLLLLGHIGRVVILSSLPPAVNPDGLQAVHALTAYLIPLAGTVLFFPGLLLMYFERIKDQLLLSLGAKQEALETQTRFVEMFSHEYRTPLAIIRTNLDIMQQKLQGDRQIMEPNLEKMQRAVGRLVEVAETAVLSDPRENSKIGPIMELLDLAEFLQATAGEASQFWSERLPRIELDIPATCQIRGDRQLLKTAFLNLLDNAIKYGPAGALVAIQMVLQGDSVRITISDRGPGIPEHELELVYGKYYRGSRTRMVAGSGMGLYLVLRIISQHAGGIGLSNRSEGGTCITVTLPVPQQENCA